VWQQVEDDIIVVARIKCDFAGPAGMGDGLQDIERLIPVERGDFYSDDVRYFSEALPELEGQGHFAYGLLDVESHGGYYFSRLAGVVYEFVD